ncbi:MAG: hypothetical protein QXS46_02330 [Candidatus Bathyarchaeia archaeon]
MRNRLIQGGSIFRFEKDLLKFLKGKYSDPKLRYEVVEETVDKIFMGFTHANNRTRPPNSPSNTKSHKP